MIAIGLDIGQKRDPTAIAVAQIDQRQVAPRRTETHFLIRHLDRLPLRTPYPEVARRVADVSVRARAHADDGAVAVYIDATGLGQPIVDLVAEKMTPVPVAPVYFTHGDRRTQDTEKIILGKAWLVSRLQALLQCGRLHLPRRSSEAQTLARELEDFEIRLRDDANEREGAFRVGTQDDLVTALGLAVQVDSPKPLKIKHSLVFAARPPGL